MCLLALQEELDALLIPHRLLKDKPALKVKSVQVSAWASAGGPAAAFGLVHLASLKAGYLLPLPLSPLSAGAAGIPAPVAQS